MNNQSCGRFAPSPSGHLHYGSLLAAVASFLSIRSKGGIWLVRIDDLDPPREVPGASDDILRTLEKYGLLWDKKVVYQSHRNIIYSEALKQLNSNSYLYPCNCSRNDIAQRGETVYRGHCLTHYTPATQHPALRIKSPDKEISWNDLIQGNQNINLAESAGDFIVRRADKLYAYHLAAAVDDVDQQITEVIRGADLLSSTPAQIYIQQSLGYTSPHYGHIPIAVNEKGVKLSKQSGAAAISQCDPKNTLFSALNDLGQNPPAELATCSVEEILDWGQLHWKLSLVPKTTNISTT